MDHKSRIMHAIQRLPVDRIPCAELVINDALVQEFCGKVTVGFEHRLYFIQTMGLDAMCLHPCGMNPGGGSPTLPDNLVFNDLEAWTRTGHFIFAVLDGPIGWGTKTLGYNQMLSKLMRSSPDMTDLVSAVDVLNAETIHRLAANGVNGIIIADDIAFTNGVIARPNILRQLLFPSFSRSVEQAKKENLFTFFHSDGNLMAVLDDIVAAGFDGLQCLESIAGMDIALIKKHYGHKLCLWGNLDPGELCLVRSRNELMEKVHGIINVAGNDSGLIFGTSSGLFEGMRLESLKCVYEFVQQGLN